MVRTPPFQGENPGSNPSGAAKNQKHPFGCFLFLLCAPRGLRQSEAHGENADKQLANLQKRIWLIEFLRLGLVIVYQGSGGAAKIKRPPFGGHFILLQPPNLNRDRPERSAWRIREHTITKSIKTEFVNTSFYRFLLLRIEEASGKTTTGLHIYKFFGYACFYFQIMIYSYI